MPALFSLSLGVAVAFSHLHVLAPSARTRHLRGAPHCLTFDALTSTTTRETPRATASSPSTPLTRHIADPVMRVWVECASSKQKLPTTRSCCASHPRTLLHLIRCRGCTVHSLQCQYTVCALHVIACPCSCTSHTLSPHASFGGQSVLVCPHTWSVQVCSTRVDHKYNRMLVGACGKERRGHEVSHASTPKRHHAHVSDHGASTICCAAALSICLLSSPCAQWAVPRACYRRTSLTNRHSNSMRLQHGRAR